MCGVHRQINLSQNWGFDKKSMMKQVRDKEFDIASKEITVMSD